MWYHAAVYRVKNQREVLLAAHHAFVGTAPPLQQAGDASGPPLAPDLSGEPSLIALMLVTPAEAEQLAAGDPGQPMAELMKKVHGDPAAQVIMAARDHRLSETVLQFLGSAPELAMLRSEYKSLAYNLVRIKSYAVGMALSCDARLKLVCVPAATNISKDDSTIPEGRSWRAGYEISGRVHVFGQSSHKLGVAVLAGLPWRRR